SISNRVRFLQTPAGHLFSRIWASYSSRKYLIVVRIGLGALLPRLHNDASCTAWPIRSSSSMSPSLPLPSQISVRISSILRRPSRQGVHLPHLYSQRKFV